MIKLLGALKLNNGLLIAFVLVVYYLIMLGFIGGRSPYFIKVLEVEEALPPPKFNSCPLSNPLEGTEVDY